MPAAASIPAAPSRPRWRRLDPVSGPSGHSGIYNLSFTVTGDPTVHQAQFVIRQTQCRRLRPHGGAGTLLTILGP